MLYLYLDESGDLGVISLQKNPLVIMIVKPWRNECRKN